ncbi:hypothetical protein SRB5_15150 [Streptomyces sp. RB5]|uniref:DUF485 domain-containing protein n=1 Tax=Streptomyces smaragdinus TaxID=2585196 RepID=A0A7K0CD60_9ACTN|nr:hypothetical protein [Streptomyces smaragdinus]MQY11399.1 hypothetical protein [Streptomyces smaragdinus]
MPRPVRTTVVHPRTLAARNAQPLPPSAGRIVEDLGRQTPLGDVYLRSLMRSQFRLALAVVGTLSLALGVLPLTFQAFPALRDATAAGIPVPWILTGVAVHPVILVLGWVYHRQSRKNERDFAEAVERP